MPKSDDNLLWEKNGPAFTHVPPIAPEPYSPISNLANAGKATGQLLARSAGRLSMGLSRLVRGAAILRQIEASEATAKSSEADFLKTSNMTSLVEAVALRREALRSRTRYGFARDEALRKLGADLSNHFTRTRELVVSDEAIALLREALRLHPLGHPKRHRTLCALSTALGDRFQHTGDGEILEEAVALGRKTLELRPPGSLDRAQSLNNLALDLFRLYLHCVDAEASDQAIILSQLEKPASPPPFLSYLCG